MRLIKKEQAPVFNNIPGLTVTGLASPSRGAKESCVWRISIAPGTAGTPHSVTREEIFVCTSGEGKATVDGVEHHLSPGDAIIIPANTLFSLTNAGSSAPFEAFVAFPVGGKAIVSSDAPAFTPPWAE
jgi:quercetin dioxygenase-like cupin family protein